MSCNDEVKCPSHLTQYVSTILKLNVLRSKEISSLTVTIGESITNIKSNRSIYSSASDLLFLTFLMTLSDGGKGGLIFKLDYSIRGVDPKSDSSNPESDSSRTQVGLVESQVGLAGHDVDPKPDSLNPR